MKAFWKKYLPILLIVPLVLALHGCVYLVVGTVGAVGGYVASPDTFEGIIGHEELAVWDASMEIISIMGVIYEENADKGVIEAKVSGAKITATLTPIDKTSTRLTVRARKMFLPKVALAQDIFVKINNYLNQ